MNIKEIKVNNTYTTDYPILEFGDVPGEIAPTRECVVRENTLDKYITLDVYNQDTGIPCKAYIKSGYIYPLKSLNPLTKG